MTKWTRESIVSELLRLEAAGLPLRNDGAGNSALYQAAIRAFGSWRSALAAAGISTTRAQLKVPWTPGKVISCIRAAARRHVSSKPVQIRHTHLVAAARRCFGSWPKALVAAGVDPAKFRRVTPWTQERILEAILARALKNDPLGSQTVRPQTLADAGRRLFGSWAAALQAAGLDPACYLGRWPTAP